MPFSFFSRSCETSELIPLGSQEILNRIRWLRSEAVGCRASAAIFMGLEGRRNLLDMAQLYDVMADEAEARLRNGDQLRADMMRYEMPMAASKRARCLRRFFNT